MKNIQKALLSILLVFSFVFTSCDKDFEEINTDPTAVNSINPEFLFTTSFLQGSGTEFEAQGAILGYSACFIQHLASVAFDWSGDKYFYNPFNSEIYFIETYINSIKTLTDLIVTLETSGEKPNLLQAARIYRAMIYQRVTDMYGDVPYEEAGRAFIDGNFKPAYDEQEYIYLDILEDLLDAHQKLDPANTTDFGSGDLIYAGDIFKWKKFAASLMLRMGMRLTKVDITLAEKWVKEAIALGVMDNIDDSFILYHQDGPEVINQNGIGIFVGKNDNSRLSYAFVRQLDSLNDPRLDLLSFVASGGPHKGLPNGLNEQSLAIHPLGDDLETYSRMNPALVTNASPMIFMHAGEIQLLLAEASIRGWNANSAIAHYENGVRISMNILSRYNPGLVVDAAAADTYLAANTLDISNQAIAMNRIHSEYWVATFLNPYESFANWRRTELPQLNPVSFTGSASFGAIPRRLRYPQREYSVNAENVAQAVSRQGDDLITTRVWWDK